MRDNMISAEVKPLPNQANHAAQAMQRLGFRILHIGPTISVQGSQSLWTSVFNVSFEPREKIPIAELEGEMITYQKALVEEMRIPELLQDLVAEVMFVEPPDFYQ